MIIPAAGFGTRVGSPTAKELLPNDQGEPLIKRSLDQARLHQMAVHLITRKEKAELISYVEKEARENDFELHVQTIDPSREWPETILQSQEFWRARNIVSLPDTVYEPRAVLGEMLQALEQKQVVFATFRPGNFTTWGVVFPISETEIAICEKPQEIPQRFQGELKAWGVFGFQKESGVDLLKAQLVSTFDHNWIQLKYSASLFDLTSFEDLTRPVRP